MKHRHGNRILSRTATARRALLKNLSSALLQHKSIVTEAAKAKELRKWFEPLVTEARRELTLGRRRRLLSCLNHTEELVALRQVAEANKERPGGYLRLTRLPVRRGDGAEEMRVELVAKL